MGCRLGHHVHELGGGVMRRLGHKSVCIHNIKGLEKFGDCACV